MKNTATLPGREENRMEYRKVVKYGIPTVEIRYTGAEWAGWYFLFSEEPKKYWIYIPELNVWRSNVSAF